MNRDRTEVVTQDLELPMRSNAVPADDSQTSLSPDATSLQSESTMFVSQSQGPVNKLSNALASPGSGVMVANVSIPGPKAAAASTSDLAVPTPHFANCSVLERVRLLIPTSENHY